MSLQVSNAFKGIASMCGNATNVLVGGNATGQGVSWTNACLGTILSRNMRASLTTSTYTASTNHLIQDFSGILLADGNGYNGGTVIPNTPPILSFDQVSGYVTATLPTVSWTATGGSIGPARGMFICGPVWDGSQSTNPNLIYFWVDFGTAITQTAGGVLSVTPQLILG